MMMRSSAVLLAVGLVVLSAVRAEDLDDDDWEDDDDDGSSLYSNPSDNSNPSYDIDDPAANHRQEGIRRDGEGNWQGALESFQAACRHNPKDAGGFNDLGVANMRVALKGIEIGTHLKASRAAYELSAEMSGGADDNLNRNLDALKDVEKWACESHEICVGAYDGSGGDGGGSLGNDAFGDAARELKTEQATGQPGGAAASALRRFVKEEVDAALKDLTMDFEIMESSMSGQIKALKTRIKTLEEKVAKGVAPGDGSYKGGKTEPEEEEVDPKDEM